MPKQKHGWCRKRKPKKPGNWYRQQELSLDALQGARSVAFMLPGECGSIDLANARIVMRKGRWGTSHVRD
jgi:hypothetical protein